MTKKIPHGFVVRRNPAIRESGHYTAALRHETADSVTLLPDFITTNSNVVSILQTLPDFIKNLINEGVSAEDLQGWLKQADSTGEKDYAESFREFQNHVKA